MARWALVLKRESGWTPVIFLTKTYLNRHMDACRAVGITVILPSDEIAPTAATDRVFPSRTTPIDILRSRIRSVLSRLGLLEAVRKLPSLRLVRENLDSIRARRKEFQAAIRAHSASVALIAESSAVHGAEAYVSGSHLEGIPIVTAPIEKQLGRHEAENFLYAESLSTDRPINNLIARLFPRWALFHRGRGIVRALPEVIIAQELARVAPLNPWRVVGNGEDVLAVDSISTREHYANEGVPREVMRIVGHAEHDMMADVLRDLPRKRAALYDRLGLPADRPLLLSPLVPDHYVSGRPECDFQNYDELVEFWVRSLAGVESHNVVISLHPGHSFGQAANAWNFLEDAGVRICHDDLPLLVPLCDIYVAAGYSTTTQWAIACGKPVVNYDVYRYAMPIYESVPGVVTVREQAEFVAALRRLATDREYYRRIEALQSSVSKDWGVLDGQAGVRMTAVFDSLISEHQRFHSSNKTR